MDFIRIETNNEDEEEIIIQKTDIVRIEKVYCYEDGHDFLVWIKGNVGNVVINESEYKRIKKILTGEVK